MFNTIEHDIWLFSEDTDREQVLLPGKYWSSGQALPRTVTVHPGVITIHPAEYCLPR